MHKQNWQEPLLFDWSGEYGPPLTEEDIFDSDIMRIIRNEFHKPFEVREYERQTPWWNPRDPNGSNNGSARYIPGIQKIPQYPQLSSLTKSQHWRGLKVLTTTYKVQPWDFPAPEQNDYGAFEKIKDIYEKEIKEYRLWARKCWVNGDCVRTLHPKPLLEAVYDAQFQLKKNEIQALPHEFTMTAQIALEPREDAFTMQPIKDLKIVDVNTLPVIDFPRTITEDISIMRHCEVPVPCRRHPTKFILPNEHSVTTLPLPEVNRQLARYAIENGATIIASEKALQCLLEYEQAWKLPVYVEEVVCPESGGVKNVVVLGSPFSLQKECGAQRSYQAFRHLLIHTFSLGPPSETSSPTHQADTSNVEHPDQFNAGEATLSSSRDDEELRNYAMEGRQSSDPVSCVPVMPRQTPGRSLAPCRPPIDDHLTSTDEANKSDEDVSQMDVTEQRRSESVYDDKNNAASDASCSSETKDLFIDDEGPEAFDLVKHENDLPELDLSVKQNLASYFGSEEETPSEESFQDESEMEGVVPGVERKQIDLAEIWTGIDLAQTSNQISFDTTTLPTKGSTNNIGGNPTSTEDNNDNSNAASDASCSSETEGLFIDDEGPEAFDLVKHENDLPELDLRVRQNLASYFGSEEETPSEESFQDESEMEAVVPGEERKQIELAEIWTGIDEAQTSNQISFDTTTLPTKGSSNNIGGNPTSTEDNNDNNCTCKGTKFEVPPPRSFVKWQVKNVASNRGFDLIIHSSHKVQCDKKEAILEPIVEWQPELGACKQSAGRLRAIALALMIRPEAYVINVRVDYKNGNMILTNIISEPIFPFRYGDKRSEIADRIHSAIEQLRLLKPGQYILAHDSGHGAQAMIYSALPAGASGAHTMSLRPDKDTLTEAEEAAMSKNLCFELSRAMLPYHKVHEILPLAFTHNKNHVLGHTKVTPAVAQAKPPNKDKKRQKNKKQKKRKSKKRRAEHHANQKNN